VVVTDHRDFNELHALLMEVTRYHGSLKEYDDLGQTDVQTICEDEQHDKVPLDKFSAFVLSTHDLDMLTFT
jgi:hypothetical protein